MSTITPAEKAPENRCGGAELRALDSDLPVRKPRVISREETLEILEATVESGRKRVELSEGPGLEALVNTSYGDYRIVGPFPERWDRRFRVEAGAIRDGLFIEVPKELSQDATTYISHDGQTFGPIPLLRTGTDGKPAILHTYNISEFLRELRQG